MKLPSFQFYPGDWLKDPNLRRCSPAARGVWMDMLCLMFECEERGVLATLGRPWLDQEIAAAVSGDRTEVLTCITELLAMGVCSRNQSGAIFSRRLVRDEQKRKADAERQRRRRKSSPDSHVTHLSRSCHASVTGLSEDEDEEEEYASDEIELGDRGVGKGESPAARLGSLFAFHFAGLGREKDPYASRDAMQDLLNRGVTEAEIEAWILDKQRPKTQKQWQFLKRWDDGSPSRNGDASPHSGRSSSNGRTTYRHGGREEAKVART